MPETARGTVKWFNTTKGFGFVALENGGEVFLHISAMEQAGLPAPAEGATGMFEIGAGKKGPQVVRVLEISGGGAPQTRAFGGPPRPQAPPAPGIEVEGTVKWFSPERGYGFVTADDGEADVFVHVDVMRRGGVRSLDTDQRVALSVVTTPKGREATAVRVLI